MNPEAKKRKFSLEKILRVILLVISFLGLPIGVHLLVSSSSPEFVATGMSEFLSIYGQIIVGLFLFIIIICIAFCVADYIQARRLQKKPTRIIVASAFGWLALITIISITSFMFVAPNIKSLIIAYTENRNDELFEEIAKDIEYNPLDILAQNYQTLSETKINQLFKDATFSHISFGTDASSNKTSAIFSSPLTKTASAKTSDVTILNRAKLSSGGRFVVFYTDTGDDKISSEEASNVAEMAEQIIQNYKSNLGLDYSYTKINSRSKNNDGIEAVLSANGINKNILETAMPIYIAEPFSSDDSTIAFYVDERFDDTLQKLATTIFGTIGNNEQAQLVVSTPTLPFVVIRPSYLDSPSLAVVTAHELGHHFTSLACNERGFECSRNNFIDETLPNFFATNAVSNDKQPVGNTINSHHELYVSHGTCYTISDSIPDPNGDTCHKKGSMEGYPPYAFLQNYADNVSDGLGKMLNAMQTDDALTYLYNQATSEEFAKVMTALSQKNLTNDYSQKSLIAHARPTGEELPCNYCAKIYEVNPAAMRYYYLPKESYGGYTIKIYGDENLKTSIMGQDEAGNYKLIDSFVDDGEYVFDKDSDYRQIAIVVANISITGKGSVTLELKETEIEKELSSDSDLEPSNSSNCITVSIADIFNTTTKILSMLETATSSSDLVSEFEKGSADTAALNGSRKVTFCQYDLKNVTNLATAEKFIKSISPAVVPFKKDEYIGVYLSYDLFKNDVKIASAMIFKDDKDALIYLINIR